jgi:hypothetical protein
MAQGLRARARKYNRPTPSSIFENKYGTFDPPEWTRCASPRRASNPDSVDRSRQDLDEVKSRTRTGHVTRTGPGQKKGFISPTHSWKF